MTNQRTLRHRKNTAHAASLHGAHYPQGARRIRKAAKPPTAAQGTPLQTQLVRAILTIAGSNRQCAAGRKVPLQRKSRGPSGSAKNPGLRFAVPEIFWVRSGLTGAAEDVLELMLDEGLDVGAGGLEVLARVEVIRMLVEVGADRAGHGQTQVGVDVDLADSHRSSLAQHIFRNALKKSS